LEIAHPAAHEERAHLQNTLSAIAIEQTAADRELADAAIQLKNVRRDDPDAVPLREMLYARADQLVRNLALAHRRPYFTRVDFIPSGSAPETHYIGKYGVLDSKTLDSVVVDWRAPIANLYYSGQVGPMHYEAPDGRVEGELTLKRQLTVENGELLGIFDTDVVAKDAYLQSVLGSMTGDRLRDIVTSIQAEQNFVIRHPLTRDLVVQGVAGSGKTTIALHRIAYLLYAFSQRVGPEEMLILAPNPLFLNFISGVLPDLGVERVQQSTFPRLMAQRLGSAMPRIAEPELTEDARAAAHYKGSPDCVARLDAFLDRFEENFPPQGIFKFGPAMLFDQAQLREFLLVAEKNFPLERRKKEFQKELSRRLKRGLEQTLVWLDEECDRRSDLLEKMTKPGAERAERMRSLYQSRNQRKDEAKEKAKSYVREAMKRFEKITPAGMLTAFWESLKEENSPAGDAARHSLALGKCTREDMALIALCDMRLTERPRQDLRHIVIDEAQDFSCAEFLLLRRLFPLATFTIVGDLMQGIRAYRGLENWENIIQSVFHGECVMHHLVISYRNTVEIMNLALRPALRHPVPGQKEIQPVLRHGPQPDIVPFLSAHEQTDKIRTTVYSWTQEGMQSIAIIARDQKEAAILHKALGYPLLNIEEDTYKAGPCIAEAAHVKGFEFDGVIAADACEKRYTDTPADARLLFVCLTRPLHRLLILHAGPLTPLLAAPVC